MFGQLTALGIARAKVDPKDIPPPTPVTLPRFQPLANDGASTDPSQTLPSLLQSIGRTNTAMGPPGLTAIGLDLSLDAAAESLVPDPKYVPSFREWERLTADEAREKNQETRQPLSNGNQSPGCQVYLERKRELSNKNEEAFRAVRRIAPPKGKQQARLGNAYEFFRCLELFTTFWDDPTQPAASLPPSPEISSAEAQDGPSSAPSTALHGQTAADDDSTVWRTSTGSNMPAEYRTSVVAAFVKLVAYDFGCSVSSSRVEPRLHLSSPLGRRSRKTFCPSACSFIFQSPQTREAARAGIVYGPVAAVSARANVNFTTPDVEAAQSLDLAREVVAALITAQHRSRDGKKESRFGEGEWWTTKPRWGGGPGGPIGREIEKYAVPGDKDAKPTDEDGMPTPVVKKPRKNMSIYDNYRMVRPPSSTWDRKAVYQAIGKAKGADHDEIFVISSLFHHISILRVRVPLRLMEVLEGSPEPDASQRSWGRVQAWRSPWYDLFHVDERLRAMEVIWSVMAYQMREDTGGEAEDVAMGGS